MRDALLALAAIPVLAIAADALAATPPELKTWIASAAGQVGETVPASATTAGYVLVSTEVESNQRLSAPRIVRSSGSKAADEAVLAAVKRTKVKGLAPYQLVDRRVTLAVPVRAAETRTAALPYPKAAN